MGWVGRCVPRGEPGDEATRWGIGVALLCACGDQASDLCGADAGVGWIDRDWICVVDLACCATLVLRIAQSSCDLFGARGRERSWDYREPDEFVSRIQHDCVSGDGV